MAIKYSLVIPVYKNAESINSLINVITKMASELNNSLEVIFVIDGSPDNSFELIQAKIPELNYSATIISHSRNFGSFAAIRTGLSEAKGLYCCVMAADLQEPVSLFIEMFKVLDLNKSDVVVGTRDSRKDPISTRLMSSLYWKLYKKYVVKDIPVGGVDVFGCNEVFKDQLLSLDESRTSLIALIYWLGFRRSEVTYVRLERQDGHSAWTMRKKFDYMLDSVFSFTDLPIRILIRTGAFGILVAIALGLIVFISRVFGVITEPGYSTTVVLIVLFGALNILGLGLTAEYAWRAYENTKNRPQSVTLGKIKNDKQ
ncbi:glycosyltransferase family 2 protein [Vibrio sp. F74]|uniref:glycosyltransferase family 2 protein n=1 Tax=Vibrio sp. F74 TaxID=700020 RepID=UPI0035F5B4D7